MDCGSTALRSVHQIEGCLATNIALHVHQVNMSEPSSLVDFVRGVAKLNYSN
jgi:hypothetical protein